MAHLIIFIHLLCTYVIYDQTLFISLGYSKYCDNCNFFKKYLYESKLYSITYVGYII